jgi:hypothetical protein
VNFCFVAYRYRSSARVCVPHIDLVSSTIAIGSSTLAIEMQDSHPNGGYIHMIRSCDKSSDLSDGVWNCEYSLRELKRTLSVSYCHFSRGRKGYDVKVSSMRLQFLRMSLRTAYGRSIRCISMASMAIARSEE